MNILTSETVGGVLKITLNRPKAFNSFNTQLAKQLQNELDKAQNDNTIRAVLLTGSGKAFSTGQDIKELLDPDGPEFSSILSDNYNPIVKKIRDLNKPIVASVNGVAGTYMLPRLIGWQKASAIMMLGEPILANEAERLGMIYKVLKDEDFDSQAMKMATKLSNMPTVALANIKSALNKSFTNNFEQQLLVEEKLQIEAAKTNDFKEGIAAFVEKRKAKFEGK